MAKSASNRHHNRRLFNREVSRAKAAQCRYKLETLSYGMINKQDLWDCGIPQCQVCSYQKVFFPKSDRQKLRRSEREARFDV